MPILERDPRAREADDCQASIGVSVSGRFPRLGADPWTNCTVNTPTRRSPRLRADAQGRYPRLRGQPQRDVGRCRDRERSSRL